jgi:hypothetical protein
MGIAFWSSRERRFLGELARCAWKTLQKSTPTGPSIQAAPNEKKQIPIRLD